MINCFTVSISLGLLVATKSVNAAIASLLSNGIFSSEKSTPFFCKKYKKQAAPMRLFPSTNE